MKFPSTLSLTLAVILTACAQNPATGGMMFTTVSHSQEIQIGQASAEAELKSYGLYKPESKQTKYVEELCNRIYAVTEMSAEPLQCVLINSTQYNAWATPGYINVYRGFLPYISTEAELAAVIAHESGHINAHHIAQAATQQMMFGIAAATVGVVVAAKTNNSNLATAAYGVSALGAGAAVMAFSRAHEMEADGLGQRYMEKAGYDKREALNMMYSMRAYEAFDNQVETAYNNGKAPSHSAFGKLYSSHPATPDRIEAARKTAGGEPDGSLQLPAGITPATPKSDPQGRRRYLEALEGLEVGPERKYGIAGADYLAVPSKRLIWRLPPGFFSRYEESGKDDVFGEWRGINPQKDMSYAASFTPLTAGMNPGNKLLDEYPGLKKTLQKINLAGETAYTGTLEKDGKSFRMVALAVPSVNTFAIIGIRYPSAAVMEEEDASVMQALSLSHTISEEKGLYLHPLQVGIFNAVHGDTVEARAAKLPTGALQQEWFRALNTLSPEDALIPGQSYKTIVDNNRPLI